MTGGAGPRRADAGWIGVIVALVLLHGVFLLLDDRVVSDDVHMFDALPDALRQGGALGLLVQSGGWLQLAMGGLLEAVGYHSRVIRALLMVAAVVVPLNSALIARRLGGPGAALAAAALVGAAPMVTAWGRQAWYHVPEAALVTTMAVLWCRDPRLERAWSGVALGALAALAVALRPSGLVWTLTLAPLAWPAARQGWTRLVPVASGWMVAAAIPLAQLWPYLWAKLEARERYVSMVEPIPVQISMMIGWAVLAVALLGVVARLRAGRARPVEWTLVSWAVLPWLMTWLFRAGIDNHTLLVPGVAVLGAVGLAHLHRYLPLGALALFALHHALLFLPSPPLPGLITPRLRLAIQDYNRPWSELSQAHLRELIDGSCGPSGPCLIATEQGLFHPFSKGNERFEMAQLGRERVEVRHAHEMGPQIPHLRALTAVWCEADAAAWAQLNPGAPHAADRLRHIRRTTEVERWQLSPSCVLVWETVE